MLSTSKQFSAGCRMNTGIKCVYELVLKHSAKNFLPLVQCNSLDFTSIVISQALSSSSTSFFTLDNFVFKITVSLSVPSLIKLSVFRRT